MADQPAIKNIDTEALEKALLEGVRAKVGSVQSAKAKKAGYSRLTSGKKTISYITHRKRGGLTLDVPQGNGGYEKIVVDSKGAVKGAVDKIAEAAAELEKKEPAAA